MTIVATLAVLVLVVAFIVDVGPVLLRDFSPKACEARIDQLP
jgi:hypothetical protein